MIETFLTHRNDQLRNACKEAIRNGTHPIVRGTLYLPHSQIQSLPEGLKVCGDLDLAYSQIRTLPDDLWVGGDLNLSYSQINELPSNLEAGGGLFSLGALAAPDLPCVPAEEKLRSLLHECGSRDHRGTHWWRPVVPGRPW